MNAFTIHIDVMYRGILSKRLKGSAGFRHRGILHLHCVVKRDFGYF